MPEPRRLAVLGRAVAAFLVVGSIVAACGGEGNPSGSGQPAGAGVRATPPAVAAATATSAATAAADEPLVVDPDLLAILPARVAGIAIQPSPDSAARMVGDAALGKAASGVAVGIVVGSGDSANDLAISSVVQLRPGVLTDQFYTEWRESYDRAACEPAGGVASHAQQSLGGHTVEVTLCHGGARTYHTRLPGDRLVSITAVGAHKLGDLVMAGLRQ